jgi:uncharacterized cupredoxin-like copper-binding protein
MSRAWVFAVFLPCVVACGSSAKSTNMPRTGPLACTPLGVVQQADQTMNVTLSEWKIDGAPGNVARGVTHFVVQNEGKEQHNFEVVRGPAAGFPKTPNGAIDEARLPAGAVLGAVNVAAGGSCDLTVRLTPGPYTLACNLVEAMDMHDVHAHFAKGMHEELDVSS